MVQWAAHQKILRILCSPISIFISYQICWLFGPPQNILIFFLFDLHLSTTLLIFLHHVPCKSAIGNPRGQTETSLGQQKWDPGGKLSYVLFLIFATPSKAIIFRPRGHVHVIIHRDLECSRSLWIIKFPILKTWNKTDSIFVFQFWKNLEKFGPFLASLLA